mgnify:CR=1 FL=1
MPQYRATKKARDIQHKLARQQAPYVLDSAGGLHYPDGAGGWVAMPPAQVQQCVADGYLEACEEAEDLGEEAQDDATEPTTEAEEG